MKKLLLVLTLLVSGAVFAKTDGVVFPHVINMGTAVQVQIWNQTEVMVRCSGSVTMYLQSGKTESQYFSEMIWPRQSTFRSLRPFSYNDRIRSVFHSIYCF